jgi:hypothetical protein
MDAKVILNQLSSQNYNNEDSSQLEMTDVLNDVHSRQDQDRIAAILESSAITDERGPHTVVFQDSVLNESTEVLPGVAEPAAQETILAAQSDVPASCKPQHSKHLEKQMRQNLSGKPKRTYNASNNTTGKMPLDPANPYSSFQYREADEYPPFYAKPFGVKGSTVDIKDINPTVLQAAKSRSKTIGVTAAAKTREKLALEKKIRAAKRKGADAVHALLDSIKSVPADFNLNEVCEEIGVENPHNISRISEFSPNMSLMDMSKADDDEASNIQSPLSRLHRTKTPPSLSRPNSRQGDSTNPSGLGSGSILSVSGQRMNEVGSSSGSSSSSGRRSSRVRQSDSNRSGRTNSSRGSSSSPPQKAPSTTADTIRSPRIPTIRPTSPGDPEVDRIDGVGVNSKFPGGGARLVSPDMMRLRRTDSNLSEISDGTNPGDDIDTIASPSGISKVSISKRTEKE